MAAGEAKGKAGRRGVAVEDEELVRASKVEVKDTGSGGWLASPPEDPTTI